MYADTSSIKTAVVGRHDELKATEALSDGMDKRG